MFASFIALIASLISLIVNSIPLLIIIGMVIIIIGMVIVAIIGGIAKGIYEGFKEGFGPIKKDTSDKVEHHSLSDTAKQYADDFNLNKRGIDTSNFSKKEIGKTKPYMVFLSIIEILLLSALIVGIVCAFEEHQIGFGILCSLLVIFAVIGLRYAHLNFRYRLSKKDAKRYKELASQPTQINTLP